VQCRSGTGDDQGGQGEGGEGKKGGKRASPRTFPSPPSPLPCSPSLAPPKGGGDPLCRKLLHCLVFFFFRLQLPVAIDAENDDTENDDEPK